MEETWILIAARYETEGKINATYESSVDGQRCNLWYPTGYTAPSEVQHLADEDAYYRARQG
jgi:hypothetical protein